MTHSTTTAQPVTDYTGPAGLRQRGTILIVPGRGESWLTYQRLGKRLAADAYRVRVLTAPTVNEADLSGSLDRFAAALTEAVVSIDTEPPARPLVLLGSDAGAATLAALVSGSVIPVSRDATWWPDALVLAGLPGGAGREVGDWDQELDVRTHCPAHRGVLSEDPAVQRGALSAAIPAALLDAAYGSTVEVPQLLLVGESDPLADQDALDRAAKALPAARLAVVHRAHHDVLNDLQHRSVAAEIVTFLEALRGQPPLDPIVTVRSTAW